MGDDIHQPLGQHRKPGKKPARGKAWSPGFVSAAAVLLLIGGAAWIALSGARIETGDNATLTGSSAPAAAQASSGQTARAGAEAAPDGADDPGLMDGEVDGLNQVEGQSGGDSVTTLDEGGEELTKLTPAGGADNRPLLLKAPAQVGQNPRLAHLPDPAVIESAPQGQLPIRGANGERPFDIYARPWSGARGARVVIIVGGLGVSQTGTQYAINTLPEEITLAFAANGNSLQRWMQEARRGGHEILLQIPFEPFDYPANDPGAGTLTVEAGAERNLSDLRSALAQITNYTGVTNFMGARFLSDADALEPVMRDLAARGVMFVDDGTSAQSLTDRFAKTLGIPYAAADMVLDGKQERGYILSKLDDLERTARRNGVAIGVASAFEVSVAAIAAWANEAKARGIEIVSASAAADDPER